jgi:hypothetical protein
MLVRYAQAHQAMMVGQLSPLNPQYRQKSAALQQVFAQRFNPVDALARARDFLYHALLQQADYWSFMNLFYVVACLCAVCVLCVLFFERPRQVHAVALAD